MRLSSRLPSLQRSLRRFSSAPSSDPAMESVAYQQSMLRRPGTARPRSSLWNSCSFIGTVARPVRRFAGRYKGLGAYTLLEVHRPPRGPPPPSPSPSLGILLSMQATLAEMSLKYLKPNDFIYVHGRLGSYGKVNAQGMHEIFYKVAVKDLSFVSPCYQNQISQDVESSAEKELALPISCAFDETCTSSSSSIENDDKENRNRLHLWQVFFANPCEWWDNRKSKPNVRYPDFKHRDTGESLWLNPNDPPWIRKQLELYDSKTGRGHQGNLYDQSKMFEWEFKDFL